MLSARRMQTIGKKVELELGVAPLTDPHAAAAAVAALLISEALAAPEAVAYLRLLAEATSRLSGRDAEDTLCTFGVICGSTLRLQGDSGVWRFVKELEEAA